MSAENLQRARLLMEQHRFKDAEAELRKALQENPNDPEVLSLLSICRLNANDPEEAEKLIKEAMHYAPADPEILYIRARIAMTLDKEQEAERAIKNALQLDPSNAEYYAVLGYIFLARKEWEKALENAELGLQAEGDNLSCLNLRSTALVKLGRKDESYETIRHALNQDPDNAFTHANTGWGLLEKGKHKEALIHFQKALKENPQMSYAKSGMIEALKARYFFYRLFLKYAFWIGNMKEGAQWVVIIGFYAGSKIVRYIADTNPALEPFLTPLIILYMVFALSTWLIGPISNLFLRLNVYGRYALTRTEILTSNFVGVCLGLGVLSGLALLFTGSGLFLLFTIFFLTMMIPMSVMLTPRSKGKRNILIGYTSLLAFFGISAIWMALQGNELFENFSTIYLIGIVTFQFLANWIIIRD